MTSKKAVWGLVVLVILAVSVVSACGGGAGEPAESEEQTAPMEEPVSIDAETLVQDRCTECHGLDRVTRASKSNDEWEATVSRMTSLGADLSNEEQTVLVDHLAQTYGP